MDFNDDKDIDTLQKMIKNLGQMEMYKNRQFLGTRVGNKYEWLKYGEVVKESEILGQGISALGLSPTVYVEE